jgi:hypothetical protein
LTPLGHAEWFANNTVYNHVVDYIFNYNIGLETISNELIANHTDATSFFFPQWRTVFYNVVATPSTYPSTAGLKDRNNECKAQWAFPPFYGYDKRFDL